MKFLLDTNVVSEVTKASPDRAVLAWLTDHMPACRICWVTVAELRRGVAMDPRQNPVIAQIVEELIADYFDPDATALTDATARAFAAIHAARPKDQVYSWSDTTIAAVAAQQAVPVVTRNVRHFPGVTVINPWAKKAPGDRSPGA